jgi:hypothetical protein
MDILAQAKLGLSTGWDQETRQDFPKAVSKAAKFSTEHIELSALRANELPGLVNYLESAPQELLEFNHVSVHGPKAVDDLKLIESLKSLPELVEVIVIHPEEITPQNWRQLGERLAIENMDCRRQQGQTVAQLKEVFKDLPEAGFCLDVAHVWTVDPTLGLAFDLLEAFRERLVEIHLSGIDTSGQHRLTTKEDIELYEPVLVEVLDVPWTLEAPLENWL